MFDYEILTGSRDTGRKRVFAFRRGFRFFLLVSDENRKNRSIRRFTYFREFFIVEVHLLLTGMKSGDRICDVVSED